MAEQGIQKARELLANGLDMDTIVQQLTSSGMTEEMALELLQSIKKEKRAKNRSLGSILLLVGSALCFASMLFTFFVGPNPWMLYGLTMLGVTIAFIGLVYILG